MTKLLKNHYIIDVIKMLISMFKIKLITVEFNQQPTLCKYICNYFVLVDVLNLSHNNTYYFLTEDEIDRIKLYITQITLL